MISFKSLKDRVFNLGLWLADDVATMTDEGFDKGLNITWGLRNNYLLPLRKNIEGIEKLKSLLATFGKKKNSTKVEVTEMKTYSRALKVQITYLLKKSSKLLALLEEGYSNLDKFRSPFQVA